LPLNLINIKAGQIVRTSDRDRTQQGFLIGLIIHTCQFDLKKVRKEDGIWTFTTKCETYLMYSPTWTNH